MKNVNTSIVDLVNQEIENTSKLNEVKTERRGRPVDSNSERQHRLSTKSDQLGRPVDPNSVRQIRLSELEMKRQNGTLKRGRPAFKSVSTSEIIDVEFEVIEPIVNEEVIEVKAVNELVEVKPKNKRK